MQEDAAARSIVRFVVRHLVRYVAFLINVPYVFSLVAMLGVIAIVLQDVYGISAVELLHLPPNLHVHVDGGMFMRAYAIAAFLAFLLTTLVRLVFRLGQPTLKQHLLTGIAIATAGWAFVLVHVPVMRMAPGTSRAALAGIFAIFYVLGVGGFAAGALIAWFCDRTIDMMLPVENSKTTA